MPRFVIDGAEKPALSVKPPLGESTTCVGVGLQTLKRGRPLEPRISPLPCTQNCCARIKENSASLPVASCFPVDDLSSFIDSDTPHDAFDEFDLGPPPPSGPVLVRQNAIDLTAAAEAKFATVRSREPRAAMVMSTRAHSTSLTSPMLLRQAMWRDK